MTNSTFSSKLARYIDAGFPILYVNTYEEDSVDRVIASLFKNREVYEWNEILGYTQFISKCPVFEDIPLSDFLDLMIEDLDGKVIILKDIVPYFEDPRIVSKIKWLAKKIATDTDAAIIIVSGKLVLPPELEKYITILELDYLSPEEIKDVIIDFAKEQEQSIEENILDEFAMAFKGLSEFEIKTILQLSLATLGSINGKSLKLIFDQKQQLIKKAGILEMIPLKETVEDIGGLENLKEWLARKSKVFKNYEKAKKFGVDMPKGVLIAGMPGCGKSLNAKAAAHLFEVPLLRLDMGRLMGKYVGESESNLRNAISLAEAISPCVLWIDELEKAFAGINNSGSGAEVTTRLFGNFLTWLQEKESPVFVVATANNIDKLPPELLRKGRFDEIFYVGLPKTEEREKIFDIHIKRRRPNDLSTINIKSLANKTEGYSGADIEGVVKESIENAFSAGKNAIQEEDILEVISSTHSLKDSMKDSIEDIERKYKERNIKNASK